MLTIADKMKYMLFIILLVSCGQNVQQNHPVVNLRPDSKVVAIKDDSYSYNYNKIRKMHGVIKKDTDLFSRWIEIQHILKDTQFTPLMKHLDDNYLSYFKDNIPNNLRSQLSFLGVHGNNFDKNQIFRNIKYYYSLMDNNFPQFVNKISQNSFVTTNSYVGDKKLSNRKVREKYRMLLETLFYQNGFMNRRTSQFAFANRQFEYAFSPKSSKEFLSVAKKEKNRPVVHLFHEGIWYFLVRTGWKYWHFDTLKELAKYSRQGKEILYIAGGSDIYNLVKNGIYNIRVVDPIYPTQDRYYSEGWNFLVHSDAKNGGIGDRIQFTTGVKNVTMIRVYFKKGKYLATVNWKGKKIKINQSVTVWEIRDKNDKKVGQFVLERRFANQNDFRYNKKKVLFMSLPELYFICTLHSNNWGVKPKLFDPRLKLYIKQLRKPIDKKILLNIQALQRVYWDFRFGCDIK